MGYQTPSQLTEVRGRAAVMAQPEQNSPSHQHSARYHDTVRATGYKVREGEGGSAPQMYHADDGCFTTGSPADLQAIFDLNWFLAKLCGLTVKVKGTEKTAYTAVRYSEGKAYNLETAPIRLPDDGTRIPQILVPAATVAKARHTVRAASKQRAATNKKQTAEIR